MKINGILRQHILAALMGAALVPGLAQAAGFALIENSASGQGNAYAGAAAHVTDASTIYFNPAGMMRLDADQISFAGHFIMPKSEFTDEDSRLPAAVGGTPISGDGDDGGSDAIVPNFYWVTSIDEKMKFGLGMQTSFGLATRYNEDWIGRYHAVETDLRTININPSIAYQVNDKLSIGGGIDVVYGDIIFSNAIDIGSICAAIPIGACAGPGANDGFAELEGDNLSDPGIGFNIGLQYEIDQNTVFGASYRSEIDLDFEGEAEFTLPANAAAVPVGTGAFVDTGIEAGVTLPQSLALSMSHKAGKITYLGDITWTGWSSFDKLVIEFDNPAQADSITTEDWDDVFRYSIGLDYQYSDRMILRTGIAYDETPVPSAERRTPRVPGNSRSWLSFGFTYMIEDTMTVDLGYSHLFISDTGIDNTVESESPLEPAIAANLNGEYEAAVDILSVQLNWMLN